MQLPAPVLPQQRQPQLLAARQTLLLPSLRPMPWHQLCCRLPIRYRANHIYSTFYCTAAAVQAGSDISMNVVWTAASLVLTRCFTVYNTAQTQRTLLQQQMTSLLYDRMQDSQEGVVSVIMEVG
eukprot:GHRQ01034572.1.p2 GENE.GHRQ01034572.1~~GHRQ01034572.1.p2  ORF type:complete len:124 (-),score=41.13 GHRQ01034572.1:96-467(-)